MSVCKHTHVNKKCRPDVKVEGHFLFIFSTFLFILCVGVSKLVPHVHMVRCQPVATGSLLPPCGAWGSHSDPKTWCQVPCSAESSCQPSYFLETGSRTEPGLHRPSGQHTPEILLSHSASLTLGIQAYCLSGFLWGFGDWVLVLRLAGQANTSLVKSSLLPSLRMLHILLWQIAIT